MVSALDQFDNQQKLYQDPEAAKKAKANREKVGGAAKGAVHAFAEADKKLATSLADATAPDAPAKRPITYEQTDPKTATAKAQGTQYVAPTTQSTLRSMGVNDTVQNSAPVKDVKAAIRQGTQPIVRTPIYEGGTTVYAPEGVNGPVGDGRPIAFTPGKQVGTKISPGPDTGFRNLGDYGNGVNIYGKSSVPGGPMNTFVGAGAPSANVSPISPYGNYYNPDDPYAGYRGQAATPNRATQGGMSRDVIRAQTGLAFGRNPDGTIKGSTPRGIREIQRRYDQARRDIQNTGGAEGSRQRLELAKAEQADINAFNTDQTNQRGQTLDFQQGLRGQDVTMRGQDLLADTTRRGQDTDVLRSQLQQEGYDRRFNTELSYKARQDFESELIKDVGAYTITDDEGKLVHGVDEASARAALDAYGGPSGVYAFQQENGYIPRGRIRSFAKLVQNFNKSEGSQEDNNPIRSLSDVQIIGGNGQTATFGQVFTSSNINLLDWITSKSTVIINGTPMTMEDFTRKSDTTLQELNKILNQDQ